jgi:hypothetical protein
MDVQAGACCRTVGSAYVGSNPTPATSKSPGKAGFMSAFLTPEGAVRGTAGCPSSRGFAGQRHGLAQISPRNKPPWRIRGEFPPRTTTGVRVSMSRVVFGLPGVGSTAKYPPNLKRGRLAREGATGVGADLGDLRASTVTAARRPVVPLNGTRGFRGGLKGLIMPDAYGNQTERLGCARVGEDQHPLQGGWLPGFTIRWSELSPARGLATCSMGARSARSAADAGGQLAGHPCCGRPSHRRPPA